MMLATAATRRCLVRRMAMAAPLSVSAPNSGRTPFRRILVPSVAQSFSTLPTDDGEGDASAAATKDEPPPPAATPPPSATATSSSSSSASSVAAAAELKQNLRPSEIVDSLNRHIVGQFDAKRAVAIAMRNRWRRRQLPEELRKEVTPRNVLLVGPTGYVRCRGGSVVFPPSVNIVSF